MESEVESGDSSVGAAVFLYFCVFAYISVIVHEDVCVRDFRVWGLHKVGIVGWLVGDECEGERDS
jgi:uncharacterized membrane protein